MSDQPREDRFLYLMTVVFIVVTVVGGKLFEKLDDRIKAIESKVEQLEAKLP